MTTLRNNTAARMREQLKTAMARDIAHLMRASMDNNLSTYQAQTLVMYLKAVRDLELEELKDMENLSTEELEKIQNES